MIMMVKSAVSDRPCLYYIRVRVRNTAGGEGVLHLQEDDHRHLQEENQGVLLRILQSVKQISGSLTQHATKRVKVFLL